MPLNDLTQYIIDKKVKGVYKRYLHLTKTYDEIGPLLDLNKVASYSYATYDGIIVENQEVYDILLSSIEIRSKK